MESKNQIDSNICQNKNKNLHHCILYMLKYSYFSWNGSWAGVDNNTVIVIDSFDVQLKAADDCSLAEYLSRVEHLVLAIFCGEQEKENKKIKKIDFSPICSNGGFEPWTKRVLSWSWGNRGTTFLFLENVSKLHALILGELPLAWWSCRRAWAEPCGSRRQSTGEGKKVERFPICVAGTN